MSETAIDHGDMLDLRDLAGLLDDIVLREDDVEETDVPTLEALSYLMRQIAGCAPNQIDTYENLSEALNNHADNEEPTLIARDYFVKYAEEFAHDIGAVPEFDSGQWPLMHIDWQVAADALEEDYNVVMLDGFEYLIRA